MLRPKTSKNPGSLRRSQSTSTTVIEPKSEHAQTTTARTLSINSTELEVPADLRNMYDLVMQYSSLGNLYLKKLVDCKYTESFRNYNYSLSKSSLYFINNGKFLKVIRLKSRLFYLNEKDNMI